MGQSIEIKRNLHIVFIDLEKAYDRVLRDVIWHIAWEINVPKLYIELIIDMYKGVMSGRKTNDFPITVGLHQGSSLSSYLFQLHNGKRGASKGNKLPQKTSFKYLGLMIEAKADNDLDVSIALLLTG